MTVATLASALTLVLVGQVTTDFGIFVQPDTLAMSTGEVFTAAVVTTRLGQDGVVALSTSVAPDGLGVSATLERSTVSAGETAILTVQTLAGAASGRYVVTVTGVEGAVTHAATMELSVTAPGQPGAGGCSTAGGGAGRGAGATWVLMGLAVLGWRAVRRSSTAAERRRAD